VKKLIMAFLLSTTACCLAAQNGGGRFILRDSYRTMWNTGWGSRFFYCWTWFEVRGDSLVFGPWNCNHVLKHRSFINPEIWCGVGAVHGVDLFATFKYDYIDMRLRDSLTFAGEYEHEALDAQLHFFSIGGRAQFVTLPLKPYIGQSVGLCRGRVSTSQMHHDIDHDKISSYSVADGWGGGIFTDIAVGISQRLLGRVSLFGEWGYRFTPIWRNFAFDSVQGLGDWQTHKLSIDVDRNIRVAGPYIAIGLEANL
jgi:hypothetical protein